MITFSLVLISGKKSEAKDEFIHAQNQFQRLTDIFMRCITYFSLFTPSQILLHHRAINIYSSAHAEYDKACF